MKSSEQTWLKLMLTTAVKVGMNKTKYLRLYFSLGLNFSGETWKMAVNQFTDLTEEEFR